MRRSVTNDVIFGLKAMARGQVVAPGIGDVRLLRPGRGLGWPQWDEMDVLARWIDGEIAKWRQEAR